MQLNRTCHDSAPAPRHLLLRPHRPTARRRVADRCKLEARELDRASDHGERSMPWIKLTEPDGQPVFINVEQITRVKPDTQVPGAKAEVNLSSNERQGVRETVDEIMRLILPAPQPAARTRASRAGAPARNR